MKPAYDISYRNEIVETQGCLFGRLARENPDCDGEDFITSYMKSGLRSRIDRAEARPANMTAVELKENFVRNDGYTFKPGEPILIFLSLSNAQRSGKGQEYPRSRRFRIGNRHF